MNAAAARLRHALDELRISLAVMVLPRNRRLDQGEGVAVGIALEDAKAGQIVPVLMRGSIRVGRWDDLSGTRLARGRGR